MTQMGEIIVDVIVRPLFAIWITLAVNYEKALLYFVLAFISCFLIALTCFCGQWMATKLLWPIGSHFTYPRKKFDPEFDNFFKCEI